MKKLVLYISTFIPLYFLIIVKVLIEILNGNLTFNVLNTLTLIILTSAIILGLVGIKNILTHKDAKPIKIKIIKKTAITEKYFLGYFSLFVLFALSFELEKVSMFVVFVLILILIGIVYIRNDLLYINPFLNILGYNFYEITFTEERDNFRSEKQAKFFCKGILNEEKPFHYAKISHQNFSLIINNYDKINKKQ